MTKTQEELKGLLKTLKDAESTTLKQIDEGAEAYAIMSALKNTGLVKGEKLEEVNVCIISSLVMGTVAQATIEALKHEIGVIERLIEEHRILSEVIEEIGC